MKLDPKVFSFEAFLPEMTKLKENQHFDYLVTIIGEAAVTTGIGTTQTCGLSRFSCILATTEGVEIARDILIAEVEHEGGVEGYTAKASLEVEVRTGATASVTTQTDRITSLYFLILLNEPA